MFKISIRSEYSSNSKLSSAVERRTVELCRYPQVAGSIPAVWNLFLKIILISFKLKLNQNKLFVSPLKYIEFQAQFSGRTEDCRVLQISLGRWFDSSSLESFFNFFSFLLLIRILKKLSKFVNNISTISKLSSAVERRTVEFADILRPLVRFQQFGIFLFFDKFLEICLCVRCFILIFKR